MGCSVCSIEAQVLRIWGCSSLQNSRFKVHNVNIMSISMIPFFNIYYITSLYLIINTLFPNNPFLYVPCFYFISISSPLLWPPHTHISIYCLSFYGDSIQRCNHWKHDLFIYLFLCFFVIHHHHHIHRRDEGNFVFLSFS